MRILLLLAVLSLSACASNGSFAPGQLVKTDIDRVVEAQRREVFASLKLLAEKLYKRNPREWKKDGQASAEAALDRLFDPKLAWRLPMLDGRRGVEAVVAAFREDFRGDRVAALVGGLGGMLDAAYEGRTEFFVLDDVDPQKLYNSARNVEIAVWKLGHARDAEGNLLLLSNEMMPTQNLSFEREFGKIIGHLDLLSKIVADKTNRTIVKMVQNLATAIFLPVPGIK